MLDSITIRKMNYFIAIVEHGNIVKAAESLFVTQPLLSKTIRELEADLGLKLFTHDNRRLVLTPAGEHIYHSWKSILQEMEKAHREALAIQKDNASIQIICEYFTLATLQTSWMARLQSIRKSLPQYHVSTSFGNLKDVIADLLSGEADLALCTGYDVMGHEDLLDCKVMATLPMYLYTNSDHPFNRIQKETWEWADFREESFMTIDPSIAAWPYELLKQCAATAGYEPKVALFTESQLVQMMEIQKSPWFMLTIELEDFINNKKITSCRLTETNDVVVAWRKDHYEKISEVLDFLQ